MSTAKSIADTFVTVIGGIATPPGLVIHRKANIAYKTDSRPTVVVWIEAEDDEQEMFTLGGSDRTVGNKYTIGIAIYRVIEGTFQTNIDSNPTMVAQIKSALAGPLLSGVSVVWDMSHGRMSEWEKFGEGSETSKFFIEVRTAELAV